MPAQPLPLPLVESTTQGQIPHRAALLLLLFFFPSRVVIVIVQQEDVLQEESTVVGGLQLAGGEGEAQRRNI